MIFKRTFFLFLLFLTSIAFAQDNAVFSQRFAEQMLNLNEWMEEASLKLEIFKTSFATIGNTLAYLGLVIGGIGLIGKDINAMQGLFGRMVIASILLALSPLINDIAVDTWESIRSFSSTSLQESFEDNYEKFELFGRETSDMLSGLASVEVSQVVQEGGNSPTRREDIGSFLRMISLSGLFLIVSTIFLMLMLVATGLAIQLAGLILPLAAGLIAVNTHTGARWLSAYIRIVSSSLFFILVIPTVFAISFDLTVMRTINVINEYTAFASESINNLNEEQTNNAQPLEEVSTLEEEIAQNQSNISAILQDDENYEEESNQGFSLRRGLQDLNAQARQAVTSMTNSVTQMRSQINNIIAEYAQQARRSLTAWWAGFRQLVWRLIVSLVMLVISLTGALFLIIRVENIVSNLLQGMSMGAASYFMGGAAAAREMLRNKKVSMPQGPSLSNISINRGEGNVPTPHPIRRTQLPPPPAFRALPQSGPRALPPSGPRALPPSGPRALPPT